MFSVRVVALSSVVMLLESVSLEILSLTGSGSRWSHDNRLSCSDGIGIAVAGFPVLYHSQADRDNSLQKNNYVRIISDICTSILQECCPTMKIFSYLCTRWEFSVHNESVFALSLTENVAISRHGDKRTTLFLALDTVGTAAISMPGVSSYLYKCGVLGSSIRVRFATTFC